MQYYSLNKQSPIASFKEAGVTMLSINPVGPNAIQNIETLKEMIS